MSCRRSTTQPSHSKSINAKKRCQDGYLGELAVSNPWLPRLFLFIFFMEESLQCCRALIFLALLCFPLCCSNLGAQEQVAKPRKTCFFPAPVRRAGERFFWAQKTWRAVRA
ncbi:hypothetical protein BDP55DRAFT_161696 [Colletotrichum godetiae]|uniref:Uncharacterized protein n=1 Tax=Colletotrichum godetiae TaxID=1209918 RepID=A0AAJ0AMS7_9PEZI|nr:uncharacterized protein BDP55DRAFT_161696 [Colletotrichum godetiae]KAK1675283.1 hypothetical protein BDP55DRAFT_161696 [Colletotrichum godetiae]